MIIHIIIYHWNITFFKKRIKIHIKYVKTTIIYFDNHIGFLKSTCFRKFNLVVNTSIWDFYCFHILCCNRHLPLMFLVIPIRWMMDQVWVSNYMNKTYMWVFSYKFRVQTKGMTWKIFKYYVWKYWHVVEYFNMVGIIMLHWKDLFKNILISWMEYILKYSSKLMFMLTCSRNNILATQGRISPPWWFATFWWLELYLDQASHLLKTMWHILESPFLTL
jgi:hypothetical protein